MLSALGVAGDFVLVAVAGLVLVVLPRVRAAPAVPGVAPAPLVGPAVPAVGLSVSAFAAP